MAVHRRTILALGCAAAAQKKLSAFASPTPTEIVATVPPGSGTDILARKMAELLRDQFGDTVVVLNKGGAAQQIGLDYVRRAKPDGRTLAVVHSGVVANPYMFKAFHIDLTNDVTPIIQLASTPWVFVAPTSVPVKTMKEFLAYARANPDRVNYGSTGGTAALDLSMLKSEANIGGQIINYSGGAQVITALLAGDIQGALNGVRGVKSMPDKLRGLAVTSAKRSPIAPELPTMAESGVSGYAGAPLWFGVFGPPGMDPKLVLKVNERLKSLVTPPGIVKWMEDTMNCEVIADSPDEFRETIRSELEFYGKAARQAEIIAE